MTDYKDVYKEYEKRKKQALKSCKSPEEYEEKIKAIVESLRM